MKSYKHISLLVFAVVIGGAILSIGNGCSKSLTSASVGAGSGGSTSSATDSTGGTSGSSSNSSDITVISGAKTVSLAYSKQIVDQLSSCVGVAQPSDTTLAMYEQKKGAVSTYGYANTVTSPMMMAVTSIAGEICNDLINQEVQSGQRLFVGFDMAASSLPNSSQIADSISRMALSCWQRNETSTERSLLVDLVNSSVSPNEALAGRKSALLICTSMLSSLDALLN